MKVIKPVQMSEALLISTNVTEIEQPWNEQYNYDVGARVYYSKDGVDYGVYEKVSLFTDKNPQGLDFSSDRTKLYVIGTNNTDIVQFNLSTAGNISTVTSKISLNYFNDTGIQAAGIKFRVGGTRMYIISTASSAIYQYNLSTAWDISTAVYTKSVQLGIATDDTNFTDLAFSSDGTSLYTLNSGAARIRQYTLSTAWEVDSTNFFSTKLLSLSAQETQPTGITFRDDGSRLYVIGNQGKDINQYQLSTLWDISTATFTKVTAALTAQESTPTGIVIQSAGLRFFTIGTSSDAVHEYSVPVAYDVATIAYVRSLQLASVNQPPPESSTWIRVGPTNKMAMFDNVVSTSTKHNSSIQVKIKVGSIDSLALMNIVGASVDLIVRDGPLDTDRIIYSSDYTVEPTGIIWSTTPKRINLDTTIITSWYDYFFFDFEASQRTTVLYQGINPGYSDAHATVTINGTGEVSVGNLIFGKTTDLGVVEYGVSAGIIDYSTKEADQYGNTTLVVRDYSKRMSANIQVENVNLNKVQRVLYGLRAKPALWVGSEDLRYEEPLIVYGFYKDFTTTISYPTVSLCSVEIEGII